MKNTILIGLLLGFVSQAAVATTTLVIKTPTGLYSPNASYDQVNLGTLGDLAFVKVRAAEQEIAQAVNAELLNVPDVKSVDFTTVNIDVFNAILTGLSNSTVRLAVDGLDLRSRIRVDGVPLLCPTAKVTVDIDDIRLAGSYNFFSGALLDFDAGYADPDIDVDCNGILGLPIISDIFFFFFDEESFVEGQIEDAVMAAQEMNNMFNIFGLAEVLNDPDVAPIVAQLEQRTNFDISGFLTNLLAGLNLQVSLRSDWNGINQNEILISGFQSEPDYELSASGSVSSVASRAIGTVSSPGANQFDLYVDSVYYGTFSSGNINVLTALYPDTRFDMIGFNDLFGVPSFNSSRRFTSSNCVPNRRCIYFTE
ncbi:MAG: hypothetical protein Tsb002_33560 [Wenzhouxiangellaceae bacterium]